MPSTIIIQLQEQDMELLDTTLRDGAQCEGITFSVEDKINVVRQLDELGIRWIECGNPGSNPKDRIFFDQISSEPSLRHSGLVAFGATVRPGLSPEQDESLRILSECPADVKTIFGKSSVFHITEVLHCTPDENLRMIRDTITYLKSNGNTVWYDAEHFFDGYTEDPEYALKTLQTAEEAGAARITLCDTNGGSLPETIAEVIDIVKNNVSVPLGIHTHNDCGLAVAAAAAAVRAGCSHVEGTIGGIGERCGNADLCTLIPLLTFKLNQTCLPDGCVQKLTHTYRTVMEIINLTPFDRAPFVGHSAFAHKGGMHMDAMIKNNASYELFDPELVGNQRRFLISDQVGRAGIYARLGHILPDLNRDSPEIHQVIDRLKQKELEGYTYENADGSFALLALDTLNRRPRYFDVVDYHVLCNQTDPAKQGDGASSAQAYLKVRVNGQEGINAAEGDGPVNALDLALRKTLSLFYPALTKMHLNDFKVRVLNSLGTASLVRVNIESSDGSHLWNTVGVSQDIIQACLSALIDSVDYMLTYYNN